MNLPIAGAERGWGKKQANYGEEKPEPEAKENESGSRAATKWQLIKV